MPRLLLFSGLKPYTSWGSNGEIQQAEPLGLDSVFTTPSLNSNIERLESLTIITHQSGPSDNYSFSQAFLQKAQIQAVKLLIHHFPHDRNTDPYQYDLRSYTLMNQLTGIVTRISGEKLYPISSGFTRTSKTLRFSLSSQEMNLFGLSKLFCRLLILATHNGSKGPPNWRRISRPLSQNNVSGLG